MPKENIEGRQYISPNIRDFSSGKTQIRFTFSPEEQQSMQNNIRLLRIMVDMQKTNALRGENDPEFNRSTLEYAMTVLDFRLSLIQSPKPTE